MVGIPGSGKSTIAGGLERHGYGRLNADTIRGELYGDESVQGDVFEVFNIFYERYEEMLAEKINIVIDNTNVHKNERNRLISLAKAAGYEEIELWLVNTSLKEALKRNEKRDRKVPVAVIEKMQAVLDESKDSLASEGTLVIFENK